MPVLKYFITLLIVYVFYSPFLFCQSVVYSHPSVDDEFIGPFSTWLNVKTQFGAIGDGVHDDTPALQAAFDALAGNNPSNTVVYLPAGNYRITYTLQLKGKTRVGIVGEDPTYTSITWNGVTGGTMLLINGLSYSRFNRISWNGNGSAKYAIDDSWDGQQDYFDTGNEFADNKFTDVGIGIHGGFSYVISFAETSIMRCKFIRNTIAGVALGNFNALDIWIWHSLFEDCAIGVTNSVENGAGCFKIYNSIFRRSLIADVKIGDVGEFSMRDNTSSGSRCFLQVLQRENPCLINIQGNKILDAIDSIPVMIQTQGQVSMLDNIIRSRPGAVGPVVQVTALPYADFFAMGNTFTVPNPILAQRSIEYSSSIVSAESLQGLTEQALTEPQPNLHRKIFEIPIGSRGSYIQSVINSAQSMTGQRVVLHFPAGLYLIDSTVTIPAKSDIQLVGDSYSSVFNWNSNVLTGPILKIEGPTKVTIKEMFFWGRSVADGILVTNVDQEGDRIFMHGSQSTNSHISYSIKGLDNAQVFMADAGYYNAQDKGILVAGGPRAKAGNPVNGRTIVYGGCGLDNNINIGVTDNGHLLLRDNWYESKYINQFLQLTGAGNVTIEGTHVANTNSNKMLAQTYLSDFSGNLTFLNSYISDRIAIAGNSSRTSLLGLGVLSNLDVYAIDSTYGQASIKTLNTHSKQFPQPGLGSYPVANTGTEDQNSLTAIMEPVRNTHAIVLTPLAAEKTDLRFYRVFAQYCLKGIEFTGSTDITVTLVPVVITSLKAYQSGTGIMVEWDTQQETGIAQYEIERSSDGVRFQKQSTQQAANRGNQVEHYSWLDNTPADGNNYYRIKVIEKTGSSKYTSIVVVRISGQQDKISVYPNPATDNKFTIQLNNVPAGTYTLKLMSDNGQVILSKQIIKPAVSLTRQISVPPIVPKGNYVLQITGNGIFFSKKIIL